MEDNPEFALKKLCCTCLSSDRKLTQLCRLHDGVNNLYSLLSYDSEAYREGFYKEATSLHVCWECEAALRRFARFRRQACAAQRRLTCIAEGREQVKRLRTFSRLFHFHKNTFDVTIVSEAIDNFIDCGTEVDIKTENDDTDDIPLSALHNNWISDDEDKSCMGNEDDKVNKITKNRSNIESKTSENKDYFVSTLMNEEEMLHSREKRKKEDKFTNAPLKCESCVKVFKSQVGLSRHSETFHVQIDNHSQCTICQSYVPQDDMPAHKSDHYTRIACLICEQVLYCYKDMLRHLKDAHGVKKVSARRKKGKRINDSKIKRKATLLRSRLRRTTANLDEPTPYGFPCAECNKCFDNKSKRWKHVQRYHREGFKCATCGKRFAFKNNLSRHELVHQTPPPREQCPTCHKPIRVDLLKVHSRIHAQRDRHTCVECGKHFVSRASYEHHLKYTQAHANKDILKYKCNVCDKGYRSRGELRDHVNYRHNGQTQHKCPICEKALATRRCITRHVRRAHQGVKEGPRDKICQQCGKAFRDKKGLREHEFIHTGERPLSCEVCGCTFRQTASLYTHRKRVHKMYPEKKTVQLVDKPDSLTKINQVGEKNG